MTKTIADLPEIYYSIEDVWETGNFPQVVADFAQEHGPIFKRVIPDGPFEGTYVLLVGPEANRFVFHTGRHHFSHELGWTPIMGDMLGKGLLNMDPPEHTRHRKMWNPAFTNSAMEAYMPVLHEIIDRRSQHWADKPFVDVYAESREITFDAAASALAGINDLAEIDYMRERFYMLLHGAGENETFLEYSEGVQAASMELGQRILQILAQRRAIPEDEQPLDVLGMMVRARDEDGNKLDDMQLLAHLNILLVAGHETTTTLSAWVLHLLATRPAERQKVLVELDRLLGDDDDGVPSVEAVRQMSYLDNFIKEAGRLYPPVIQVPRGALSDFEFAGYTIPAGTPVRLGLAAGHILPDVFSEPHHFDPDRFAEPRREDRKRPYSLVTFGGGTRICIGISFAQIEVKLLVAHVLRKYELEAVSDHQANHVGLWTAVVPQGIRLRAKRKR